MKEIEFPDDLSSIEMLEKIFCSYGGRARETICGEPDSFSYFLALVFHRDIRVFEIDYRFDRDIRSDQAAVAAYNQIVNQTRWKQFEHTEIEGIRMNALKQMQRHGEPCFDEFILYSQNQCAMHCGNLLPHNLLTWVSQHNALQGFFIFPYPYAEDDGIAHYYCLAFSESFKAAADKYQNEMLDKMQELMEKSPSPYPPLPEVMQ